MPFASGLAYAVRADELMTKYPEHPDWKQIKSLAKAGLHRSPLLVRALRQTSLTSEASGQKRESGTALQLAQRLSRRDSLTNFSLIEQAVAADDIKGALHQYDLTLKVSNESHSLLLPRLGLAISEPRIQSEFIKYVRAKPIWLAEAVSQIASDATQPTDLAKVLVAAGGLPKEPIFRDLEGKLLYQLFAKSSASEAKNYFLSLDGANPLVLQDTNFLKSAVNQNRAPFTWGAYNDADVNGSFETEQSTKDLTLKGTAAAGKRGLIARKILFLKPALYYFSVRGRLDSAVPSASLSALLSCAEGSPSGPLARISITPKAEAYSISLPSSCRAFFFDIELNAGDGQTDAEATVFSATLKGVN